MCQISDIVLETTNSCVLNILYLLYVCENNEIKITYLSFHTNLHVSVYYKTDVYNAGK